MTSSDTSWKQKFALIAKDRTHGASVIVEAAADALMSLEVADIKDGSLKSALRELYFAQSAMAPVARFVSDLRHCLNNPTDKTFDNCKDVISSWKYSLQHSNSKFNNHLLETPPDQKARVALFSYSSTTTSAFQALADNNLFYEIAVAESNPGGEGKHAYDELRNAGHQVCYYPDPHFYDLVSYVKVDALVLGCDALDNQYFINKIGSGSLAELAHANKVRVELWTSSLKFLPPPVGTSCLKWEKRYTFPEGCGSKEEKAEYPLFGSGLLEFVDYVRCENGLLTVPRFLQDNSGVEPLDLP